MKMLLGLSRLLYITITFALVNEMSITVYARDSNNKRRTKTGGFQNNICDITDRESKVHCYCESTREPRNATKAECWVFSNVIPGEDLIWQSFASQPNLLTLSFNVRVDGALPYIPSKALHYLQKLRSINVKYGNIVQVTPFALANLTNLKEAMLSQNQIEQIRPFAFSHLPNITVINLEENMIFEIINDAFYDVPQLQKLVFTKNNISTIRDGAFQHTFNLLELDLNKNNIFHLNRRTFDGLANLRKLDLRKNHIFNLTEFTFAELWNLQELLLGKNDLKFISERAFDGLSQLKKLYLDENKLVAFPPRLFEGVRGLSFLDLRLNHLHRFTFDNVKPILENLRMSNSSLFLEDNDFVCDCQLKWVHLFLNETASLSTKTSLENLTCKLNTSINLISDTPSNFNDMNNLKADSQGIVPIELKDKATQKIVKKNVLKLPSEALTCPIEVLITTLSPIAMSDPVIVLENEIKSFYRLDTYGSGTAKIFHNNQFLFFSLFIFDVYFL